MFISKELSKKLIIGAQQLKRELPIAEKVWIDNETNPITLKENLNKYNIPAYDILYEICAKYRYEFFDMPNDRRFDGYEMDITEMILGMIQNEHPQKKIEEFIWDNCFYNPNYKIIEI